jgi:D-alanine-D-alanine ligase
MRVAVLRGGMSDEYAVSLATGSAVLREIDRNLFDPIDVTITRSGEWLVEGRVRYPEHVLPIVDVVFIALHGAYGEDGTVQRLIERFSVPYTGSRPLPSSIAFNKALTKDSLRDIGIIMAPHVTISRQNAPDVHRIAEKIVDTFGPQYFIKPIASGSSVGTMMVKNPLLLPQAIKDALEHYDEIIIEPRIIGREATCGVVERYRDTPLYSLPPIEIVPPSTAEFFDNTVKYDDSTEEICPGRFTQREKQEIETASKLVHEALGLSQYSRSDFIVANDIPGRQAGGIYFLEVNTLPGLTDTSLLPKAISAVGGTYRDFISHLIEDAISAR